MRKICDKKEKIHKEGQKSPLEPGRAIGAGGGGVPGGSGASAGKGGRAGAARAAQWGPRRVGRPGGERRARRSGEGCPEWSGGSARVKRRLRPPQRWVSTTGAGAAAMGAKMPLLMGDQAGHGDHCGKESSWRRIFLRNNREETRQATSAMGKASQTSSSTPVSEKRYATGMRMIS